MLLTRILPLGNVSTPTDSTADGGGISLKGATDKLFRWLDATDSWTSSEHSTLLVERLITSTAQRFKFHHSWQWRYASSLTSVGTLSSGTWSASTIAVNKGGTGQTSYTNGQLLIGNTTGNTLSKATLTAGSNITITNSEGGITIAAAAGAPTGRRNCGKRF